MIFFLKIKPMLCALILYDFFGPKKCGGCLGNVLYMFLLAKNSCSYIY